MIGLLIALALAATFALVTLVLLVRRVILQLRKEKARAKIIAKTEATAAHWEEQLSKLKSGGTFVQPEPKLDWKEFQESPAHREFRERIDSMVLQVFERSRIPDQAVLTAEISASLAAKENFEQMKARLEALCGVKPETGEDHFKRMAIARGVHNFLRDHDDDEDPPRPLLRCNICGIVEPDFERAKTLTRCPGPDGAMVPYSERGRPRIVTVDPWAQAIREGRHHWVAKEDQVGSPFVLTQCCICEVQAADPKQFERCPGPR